MTSKPKGTKAQSTSPQTTAARKAEAPAVKAAIGAAKVSSTVPSPALKPASAASTASSSKPAVKRSIKDSTKVAAAVAPKPEPKPPKLAVAPTAISKQSQLISKLGAVPGLTIDQMMALTGWQAHTVRGTISGVLRKKLGLNVVCESSSPGNPRLYRIAAVVTA